MKEIAKILEGKKIAESLKLRLLKQRKLFKESIGLACLTAEEGLASKTYIKAQRAWANSLDIEYKLIEFDKNEGLDNFLKNIEALNADYGIHGIIVHKPLPSELEEVRVFEQIDPLKDIEGLSPYNLGRISSGNPVFVPPTVLSVMKLIDCTGLNLYGKDILIVGYTAILGKPLSMLLAEKLATVSLAHIGTWDAGRLPFYVKSADILISAVGKPHLIRGDWVKKGAVVIDVGINRHQGKLVGDVEFNQALNKASFITPVPGGVGILTTAYLFENLLKAAVLLKNKT